MHIALSMTNYSGNIIKKLPKESRKFHLRMCHMTVNVYTYKKSLPVRLHFQGNVKKTFCVTHI